MASFTENLGLKKPDRTDRFSIEDFNGNMRILVFLICQVNECPGDPVCHLIRVARIHFFKHGVTPFSHGAGAP